MTDTRPGPDAATAVSTPSEAGPSSPPRAQQPSSSSADASASPATSPKEQEDTGRPRRRRRLPIGRVNLGASGLNFLGFDNAKGDEKAAETTGGGDEESSDPTFPEFDGDLPWSQRSWLYEVMPFRGMWYDVRRRLPYYASDWTEAFHPRNWWTVAQAVVRIYFINLMPALAYILDMNHRTHGAYGVNEVILASALAAIVFPIFSVQPLTFVGVTGLINLVNYTQYDIVVGYYGLDQMDYLRVQAWSLIWAAGFHFITAIFNISDFSRFITDMTSTTFGFYVGIVYIQKGIELLILEYEPAPLDNATGWLSVTIASLFVVSVYLVSAIGRTSYLPYHVRTFIASFAFAAGCIFWTGFSHFPKNSLERVPIERLPITRAFFPTMDRSWFIDFWNIEAKWAFVGAPLGFLITILFYFDHNVSSIMAQARQFPVKRPAGFHWDFFLLGITTLVSGFLGLPAPNGLVPQCPWHTEALSVFKQVKVPKGDEDEESSDLKGKSSRHAGKVRKQPVVPPREHVVNTRVVEQRVSHLLIGGLTLATMTRPFLVALGTMPRAVFAGIFILVGWGSIEGNIITTRTLAVFRDRSMAPADDPLNQVRRSKIALFVAIQWFFFAITFAISQTIAGIGFPVLITLLIPFRYWVVPKWFSPLELRILDAPTADANVVLASIGHESQRCTGQGVKIAEDTKIAGTEYYDDENSYSDSDDDDVQPYSIEEDEDTQRQHAERASSPKKAARVSSSTAHRRSGSVPAVQESPFGTTHTMTFREPAIAHLDAPADGKSRKNRRSIIGRILGRSQHGSEGSTAAAAPSSSTSAAANMPAVPTAKKASEKLISGQPAARDTAEYEKEQKEVGKPSTITLSGAPAAREVSQDLPSSAGPVETKSGDKVEPAATSAPKAEEPAVPAGALAAGGAAAGGGAGLAAAAASQSKTEEPKAASAEPASSGVAQNGAVAKEAAEPAPALPQTSAAPATTSAATQPTVLAAAAPQTSSGADAAQGTKTAANDGKTTAEIAAAAGVAGGTAAAGLATAAGKKEVSDVEKYEAQRQAAADTLAKAEERQKALKEEKKSKQSNSARVKEEKALEKKRAAEAKKQLKEAEKHKKEAEKESKRQAVLAVQKEKREREEAARAAQAQKVKDAEAAKKQKKEAEEAAKKQKKADEEAAKNRKKEDAAAAAAAATAAAAAEKAKKDKEAEDEKKRQEEEKQRKAETDKAVAASKKESDKAVAAAQADADKAHKEAEQAKKQQKDGEAKAQKAVDAAKTEEQHAKDAEEKKKAEEAAAAAAAASAAAALAEVEREKKKRQEAEEARLDAEKAQKEVEDKAKKDAEEKEKREAEEKQKKEAEEKARQEAEERRKKEEAEAAAAAAAALKKKEEEVAAAKAQLEEEHKARLEAEKKAQENAAALQAKLDEEHKAREEAEAAAAAAATAAAAKLEQEHKAREEAEKQGKEAAAAAAAKLEQEHAARVEAEKKAQEDAEKAKASLDEEHKAREKAEAEAKEEHQKRLDAEKEVKSVTSGGDEATSPKASREDEENDAELAGLAATAAAALGAHEAGKGAETPAEIDAKKADRMWRSAAGVEGVTPGEEGAALTASDKKTPSKDQQQDKDGSSGTGFLKRIFTTRRASTKSVHGANDTEAPVVPPLPTKSAGEDKSVQKKDISAPATPKDEERPASFIKTGGRKLFAAEPSLIATPSKSSTKDKGKSKAKDEVKPGDKELPQAPVDSATKKDAAAPAPAPAVDLEKPSSDAAAPATPTRKPSTSVKRSNSSKPNKGSASKTATDAGDSDAAKRPADMSKQSRFSSIFTSGLGLSTGGYAAHQKKSANASSNGGSSDGGKAAAPATPPATAAATQSPASPRKSTASTRRSRDVAASPPTTEAGAAAAEKKPKDDGLTREIEQDGQRFIEHINPRFANLGNNASSASASPKSAKKGKKGGAAATPAKSAPAVQWRS